MGRWGMPPPAERPDGNTPAEGPVPPVPSAGFGAAFKSLVGRKLRELSGRRWRGASERARQAEAARRGAAEMARRIERQTGHRPAEATIRRNARQDRTPKGVDQRQVDRQSRIDAAGGIEQFARQVGAKPRSVPQWRDSGASLVGGAVRIVADVAGMLWSDGRGYPRSMTVSVTVSDPEVADEIRAAYAAHDYAAVGEMLGPVITDQTDWSGDADRSFDVDVITDITIT